MRRQFRGNHNVSRKRGSQEGAFRAILLTTILTAGLSVGGCAADAPLAAVTPSPSAGLEMPSPDLIDPLVVLKNPDSTDFVEGEIMPLIHEQGTGPQQFEIERPDAAISALKFFVSCDPLNTFTVTTSTFYSGPCSTSFSSSGSIPLTPGVGSLTVSIDVPEDVAFWLVALPVQGQ